MKEEVCAKRKTPPQTPIGKNSYDCFGKSIANYIRTKAGKLIESENFPPDGRLDIQQEFALEIVRQMEKYNPARSKKYTFIQRLIEHRIVNMLKHKNARCRNGAVCLSLSNMSNEDINQIERIASKSICNYGMKSDLEEAIAALPEDLRDICDLLRTMTVSEIARKTCLPRSTVFNRIKRIRKLFQKKNLDKYLKDVVISDQNFV